MGIETFPAKEPNILVPYLNLKNLICPTKLILSKN